MSDERTALWLQTRSARIPLERSGRRAWSPPSASDFDRLRQQLDGAELPPEYREFVSTYGGALFGDEDYAVKAPLAEPSPWGKFARPEIVYPLLRNHPYSLEDQLQTYRDRVPRGVLPISNDPGGNQICLDVRGEFPGSVWFWDHEQRWFTRDLQAAAGELERAGHITRQMSTHAIVRAWARDHPERCDRPSDYMGMYRVADTFEGFLDSLQLHAE